MRTIHLIGGVAISVVLSLLLSSCSSYSSAPYGKNGTSLAANYAPVQKTRSSGDYASRLPQTIATREKTVVVDPNVHAWGAYDSSGSLVRAGIATAGANWCPDTKRPCHTKAGTFRVNSLGSPNCKSSIFPLGKGGAPMPYCMFFNKNQALHGTPADHVVEGNISHGCVRMQVSDAEWLRYNFVNVGTKVVVRPY